MNGLQIQSQAEIFLRESMDSSTQALVGINEGISKMGDLVEDIVPAASYTAYTWYPLPSDCVKVTEVNLNDGYNTIYTGWRLSPKGQQILFPDAETCIIHYTREAIPLSTINDTPEMPAAFHKCLITYLKGWFRASNAIDDDEKREGENLTNAVFYRELEQVKRQFGRGGNKQMIAQRHA